MEANSEYQSQFSSEGLKHMSRQREKPSDSLSSGKECEFVLFFFFTGRAAFSVNFSALFLSPPVTRADGPS